MRLNNNELINQLMLTNPEVKVALDRMDEENHLILSRFTHELRNPLTLVKSTLQLIEGQHPEVKTFKYWDQIQSDLNDTVAILNQLSIYNHCEQLELTDINFLKLMEQSVEGMKPLAAQKQVKLVFTSDPDVRLHVISCDAVKIKEVITNLLKNAVEAAWIGSTIQVDLTISTGSNANGNYINLSVTNSGSPISQEFIHHIFEPFVTTKSNGSGLGLAISKKIAMLHKGTLSVSQTDDTVTFLLQLPIGVTSDSALDVAL